MKYGSCYMDQINDGQIRIGFVTWEGAARFTRWLYGVNRREPAVLLADILRELEIDVILNDPGIGWLTPIDFEVSWTAARDALHCVLLPAPEKLHVLEDGRKTNAVWYVDSKWKEVASKAIEAWRHLEKSDPEVPYPTKVIRSGPMTIAVWPDKSKTYVRIKDDDMSLDDPEKALALVTLKKLLGPHKFRKLFKEFLDKK